MNVSVVIPTLNEEHYLPYLLGDLFDQTYDSFEIIVSDGESTDHTREVAKDAGVRYVQSKKSSPAKQRNAGAKIAKGKILIFFDADNRIYDKRFIEKAVNEFNRKEASIGVFRLIFDSWHPGAIIATLGSIFNIMVGEYIPPVGPGAGIIVKKELHDRLGGFNTRLKIGEDMDYINRGFRLAKFRVIKSVWFFTSVRRFKKTGYLSVFYQWLSFGLKQKLNQNMDEVDVEYEFGVFDGISCVERREI